MKTFKQYITENTKMDLDSALKMCKSIITGTPFYFNWQVRDSRGTHILIGTRDVDDCVNRETGSRFLARLERNSWESIHGAEYRLALTYPACKMLTYQGIVDFRRVENMIEVDNVPMFEVSYGAWDIELPIQEGSIAQLNHVYTGYNIYIATRGTKVQKVHKLIEHLKRNGYGNTTWTDEDEMEYNKFKIKYLPREDLTDDDYALDAAHNL